MSKSFGESDDLLSGGDKLRIPRYDTENVPKLSKKPNFMSTSSFQTLTEELAKQELTTRKLSRTRSESMGGLADKAEKITFSPREDTEVRQLETQGRRTLYGTLPFVAAFGMQNRENTIRRVVSSVSCKALNELHKDDPKEAQELTKMLLDVDADELIITFPLLMAVLVAIIAQFLVGYNTGVMNAPQSVVFPDHTTAQWSLAVAAFAIGGPGGAVLGGNLANRLGRRGAMLVNIWIFMAGGLMMTFAINVYWLIPARFTIGFASGLATVVVPVYLGEIAPPTLRGMLGTCTQFAMVIGILVSGLLAFPFATTTSWRYLFAVTPILSIVELLASPFLLESPRWLLNKDEHSVEARVVIKKIRGFRLDSDVETEVEHFLFAAAKHKTNRTSAHSSGAMWDLLCDQDIRVLVVSAIVLQIFQQLCGINAVFYYSTSLFDGVIDNPVVGTNLVALVNVLATYVALKLMDSTARKTLILWSAGGMLVSTIFIIAALKGYVYKFIAVISVMSFVSFFEIGLGPIPWLIVAEMFDSKYVATAMSMACIANWGCNFLVGLCFPFMQEYLGAWCFGPFGIVLVVSLVFTASYLPETHGRTVDEIHRMVRTRTMELESMHYIEGVDSFDLEDHE